MNIQINKNFASTIMDPSFFIPALASSAICAVALTAYNNPEVIENNNWADFSLEATRVLVAEIAAIGITELFHPAYPA